MSTHRAQRGLRPCRQGVWQRPLPESVRKTTAPHTEAKALPPREPHSDKASPGPRQTPWASLCPLVRSPSLVTVYNPERSHRTPHRTQGVWGGQRTITLSKEGVRDCASYQPKGKRWKTEFQTRGDKRPPQPPAPPRFLVSRSPRGQVLCLILGKLTDLSHGAGPTST